MSSSIIKRQRIIEEILICHPSLYIKMRWKLATIYQQPDKILDLLTVETNERKNNALNFNTIFWKSAINKKNELAGS